MITIGQAAPEYVLSDQNGRSHRLSDYKGTWVLVYVYPKDDTPGCTKEACGIRDNFPAFEKINAVVFGISADSVKSHHKFMEKYQLPFTLLSDESKETINAYGAWGEKSMFGKKYMGILRNSYLINPDGKVVKIYEKVKPEGHAQEVLNDITIFSGA